MKIDIQYPAPGKSAVCEPILRALPQWFGLETAIQEYVKTIDHLPTILAVQGGYAIGFLTIKQHFDHSAEIYVMGIVPDLHGYGIGQRMMQAAEAWLRQRGVEYLQVKTLGPSRPDEHYIRTHAFYHKMGFRALEEFLTLWDDENPCLLMVKHL